MIKAWNRTVVSYNHAHHIDVPLIGSGRDRRKRFRLLQRMFPLAAIDAISSNPKQPYISRHSVNRVTITHPAQ